MLFQQLMIVLYAELFRDKMTALKNEFNASHEERRKTSTRYVKIGLILLVISALSFALFYILDNWNNVNLDLIESFAFLLFVIFLVAGASLICWACYLRTKWFKLGVWTKLF